MSLHQALTATRLAGRHRPGDDQPTNGRRLIPAKHRVPDGWTPADRVTGTVPVLDDTAVITLPPDIDLAEVAP